MKKISLIMLMILCAVGAIFSLVMTVMAAKFMEYGRFLFYGSVLLVCISLFLVFLSNTKNP